MPLGSFIAGRYATTYDPPGAVAAADVGITEEGYELQVDYAKELIQNSDAYGDMVIDGVYRGLNVHLQANGLEWKAGALNAMFPYAALAPSGAGFLSPGIIGRLDSDIAGILIMTATAGTPAAASPATLTATFTIIAENSNIRLLYTSKLRRMPFRWRMLPYNDAGTIKIFSVT